MKKYFLTFLIFITSLYAYNYSIRDGWQMIGVVENIKDMNNFDNSCVKSIWRYDDTNSSWQIYKPNNIQENTLNYLDIAMGFWIQADGDCYVNPPKYILPYRLSDDNSPIIDDFNNSKRFEMIYTKEAFSEIYLNYVHNNPTPDVDFNNNSVLILRTSNEYKYSLDTYVKEVKDYLSYTEISIETRMRIGGCNYLEDNLFADIEFISIPKTGKEVLLNEKIKIEGCTMYGKQTDIDINETFLELSFREIDLINNYGETAYNTYKRLEVVQNLKVFEYLYQNHINPVGVDKELPFIDFEKETLLTLFLGLKGSTGYDIKVKSIKEYEYYIEVEIENTLVGYGCPAGNALTSPVTFVTIPKTNKEIIFKEYTIPKRCEYPEE